MKYRLLFEVPEVDEVPASILRWFDREEQAWVVEVVNAAGQSVAPAILLSARSKPATWWTVLMALDIADDADA